MFVPHSSFNSVVAYKRNNRWYLNEAEIVINSIWNNLSVLVIVENEFGKYLLFPGNAHKMLDGFKIHNNATYF